MVLVLCVFFVWLVLVVLWGFLFVSLFVKNPTQTNKNKQQQQNKQQTQTYEVPAEVWVQESRAKAEAV